MLRRDRKEILLVTTEVVVVMTGVVASTNVVVAEGEMVPGVVRAAVVATVTSTLVDIGD